jgi:Flp pilus assembly pilin Flp
MKKIKKIAQPLKNQKGQGTAEYILLLVIVVGLVVMFKDKISKTVAGKIDGLTGQIQSVE